MQPIPDYDVILSVMLVVSTGADTGWKNMRAGDDYSPAAAGGNRPLLFVMASFPFLSLRGATGDVAISLARLQSLVSPMYLY